MKKRHHIPRTALAVTLLMGASAASADIQGGVGVSYLDLGASSPLSLGTAAIDLAAGWRMNRTSGFSISPEARLLTGLGDASSGGVNASLRTSYGVQARMEFDFQGSNLYFFATPAYSRLTVRAEVDSGPFFGLTNAYPAVEYDFVPFSAEPGVEYDFVPPDLSESSWVASWGETAAESDGVISPDAGYTVGGVGSEANTQDIYVHVPPRYASTQQNGGSVSVRESNWLWSISTGLGMRFTDEISGEVRYERTESINGSSLDFYGVSLRYHF